MTSQEHKKHADLQRPSIGRFGRIELGLIGAPCNIISNFVEGVTDLLKPQMYITYIDADHHAADQKKYTNLTDRISHHRIDYGYSMNDFDQRILLQSADLIFINGNHFESQKQIVFCTEKKKDSLKRKLEKLTDVRMIILDNDISDPHSFLKSSIANFSEIPIFRISDLQEISEWIRDNYFNHVPKIKGLVLAGGKSQRMGKNKAFLDYHNMPQVTHACKQMIKAGIEPVISCRNDQSNNFTDEFAHLYDTFSDLGPFGAILSAFRSEPDCAWLVIACDQPLLSSRNLEYLINNRNPSKIATCYHNPETNFPEPLITLWEPRAYQRLLSFLSLGYSCPRKVLINSDIKELHVEHSEFMINANTPEERKSILDKLKKAGTVSKVKY